MHVLPEVISEMRVGEDATNLDFILILGHNLLDRGDKNGTIAKAGWEEERTVVREQVSHGKLGDVLLRDMLSLFSLLS